MHNTINKKSKNVRLLITFFWKKRVLFMKCWCHWCRSKRGCSTEIFSYTFKYLVVDVDDDDKENCPTIVTKQRWGGRTALKVSYQIIPVPNVVIHHTVTQACDTKPECSTIISNIQNHHMNELDFDDIGYKCAMTTYSY